MVFNRFNAFKYIIYILLFLIVLIYSVFFNLKLESDNLNYYNIYNNINNDPFPFYFEFVTSSLMFLFKILGFDFYLYTFLKLTLFLPAFIKLDNFIFNKNKILSVLFLFSTLYPPFIDMMIFLSRQSLSINFLIFALISNNKKYSFMWLLLSVTTHVSSLVYLPIFLFSKFFFNILMNKFILLILLIYSVVGLFYKSLSTLILEIFNNNLDKFPEIIRQNIIMKVGFYDWNDVSEFDKLSNLRIFFIFLNIIILLFFFDKSKIIKIDKENIVSVYLFSTILFALTIDNSMMATRIGFFSYYFCLSWLIILVFFSKRFILK